MIYWVPQRFRPSLIKISPFCIRDRLFKFEIFQSFDFLIFQNKAILAERKWLNVVFLVKQVISKVQAKFNHNQSFVFEIFTFEIFQSFGFLIFQNTAIQAERKWLNIVFVVKRVISNVQAKFNQNRSVCIRDIHIWNFSIFRFSNFSKYGYTSGKKMIEHCFSCKASHFKGSGQI